MQANRRRARRAGTLRHAAFGVPFRGNRTLRFGGQDGLLESPRSAGPGQAGHGPAKGRPYRTVRGTGSRAHEIEGSDGIKL